MAAIKAGSAETYNITLPSSGENIYNFIIIIIVIIPNTRVMVQLFCCVFCGIEDHHNQQD